MYLSDLTLYSVDQSNARLENDINGSEKLNPLVSLLKSKAEAHFYPTKDAIHLLPVVLADRTPRHPSLRVAVSRTKMCQYLPKESG